LTNVASIRSIAKTMHTWGKGRQKQQKSLFDREPWTKMLFFQGLYYQEGYEGGISVEKEQKEIDNNKKKRGPKIVSALLNATIFFYCGTSTLI
jgi:hypothetical protein